MTDWPPLTPDSVPGAGARDQRLILSDVRRLTMGEGGIIRTAASGQRIELTNDDRNYIRFYSGDDDEEVPAYIAESVNGSGVTRTLQLSWRNPFIDVDDQGVAFTLRSASPDGSTTAPGLVLAKVGDPGAGTGMDPEFRIQNSIPLYTDGMVDAYWGSLRLPVKTTTGDPATGSEGQLVMNNFDNTLRLYCDGSWRTVFSW